MAEIANEPKQTAKPSEPSATYQLVSPMRLARGARVVDRASDLSDEVLKSLEAGERAAIEALGQFVITIEEALPQEVASTSEVAKKVTESGLQMADRLVHTQYDVVRDVIASAAKSLSSRNGARPKAAQ
jgi:hypothetical protein